MVWGKDSNEELRDVQFSLNLLNIIRLNRKDDGLEMLSKWLKPSGLMLITKSLLQVGVSIELSGARKTEIT